MMTMSAGDLPLRRIPNSIDTLAPSNRFVKAINTIPVTRGIPYHSIMGDRGRGDTPNSSDGVVPYWSSHLEEAQSELIVPSDHSAHQNRQAIEEVRRILKLHARSSTGARPVQPAKTATVTMTGRNESYLPARASSSSCAAGPLEVESWPVIRCRVESAVESQVRP